MEREANVPKPSASSSSQRAAPDCMRQAQAMIGILKRQRPTSVLPPQGRRQVGVETELPKVGSLSLVPSGKGDIRGEALNDSDQSVRSGQEDTSLAPFDTMGTVTDNLVHQNLAVGFGNRSASETDTQTDYEAKSVVTSLHSSLVQHKKSILPSVDNVHTAYSSMLDHKNYCKLSDQTGTGNVNNLDLNKRQDFQRSVAFNVSGSSANIQHFMVHPVSRSSLTGLSCATTTSVHSVSAPLLNSTAYSTQSNMGVETVEGSKLNLQSITQGSSFAPSGLASQSVSIGFAGQTAVSTQVPSSAPQVSVGTEDQRLLKGQGLTMKCNDGLKAVHYNDEFQEREHAAMQCESVLTSDLQTKIRSPKTTTGSSNATGKSSNSTSRKKNSNADLFFKVNKKLYQKLGKIGSGGSSEVYKVISSDCTIYALKMIKLKGRDYSTAYGFCQEIKYLNKLRGRNNIIQLVDYEVTDRTLLEEVSNSSMTARDGKIKEEGYIYVVLEFGEIDLAHMLSQQWKEMNNSNQKIDENWLRFYWQQMLLAVNTIHEERIVHSDLKPANFLLVRGSLKLIDFGIAKALLNDTTNIQRDAQVGTLNYMSPEAFMWNEEDTSGNTIKCGRPSDIWSLGCILYQMVYGRTPFSEHKNFWAKFKAITDRNHQIKYEPVSNPLLIDLMKKCLSWDRDNRWRIPQLLQHPFLMPPALSHSTPSRNDHCQLLMQMAEVYGSNPQVSSLCCRLRDLITNIDEARLT